MFLGEGFVTLALTESSCSDSKPLRGPI